MKLVLTMTVSALVYFLAPPAAHAGCANEGDPGCPPQAVAVPKELSDWRLCEKDADCVQITTGGCAKDAVNKAHQAEAEKFYSGAGADLVCPSPARQGGPACLPRRTACMNPDGTLDPAADCVVKSCSLAGH